MGFKRERAQRHSNVYLSNYCKRVPHHEKVPIPKKRSKFIYKVPLLKAQGANPKTLGAKGGFSKACSGV